jgi:hypothetical protein
MRTCQHSPGSFALTDLAHAHDHSSDQPTHCANCGAAVSAHFCATCGQETRLHMPSAGEFAHEFVGHYIALEGKLWKSLLLLACRPGRLTFDYLAGRRARYVQPLRLYLTFSVLFLALFQYSGFKIVNFDDPANALPGNHTAAPRNVITVRPGPAALSNGDDEVTVGKVVAAINPAWAPKAKAFDALGADAKSRAAAKSFFSYGPYALFLLMPVFALYLKLLYLGSGRRYGEHLLFSFVQLVLVLWLLAYLPMAMQRVYGGARWATALRWLVLVVLHALSIACAILAAFGLAVII